MSDETEWAGVPDDLRAMLQRREPFVGILDPGNVQVTVVPDLLTEGWLVEICLLDGARSGERVATPDAIPGHSVHDVIGRQVALVTQTAVAPYRLAGAWATYGPHRWETPPFNPFSADEN